MNDVLGWQNKNLRKYSPEARKLLAPFAFDPNSATTLVYDFHGPDLMVRSKLPNVCGARSLVAEVVSECFSFFLSDTSMFDFMLKSCLNNASGNP